MKLFITIIGCFLLLKSVVGLGSSGRFSYLGWFACANKSTGCAPRAKGPSRYYGPAYALAISDARAKNASSNATDSNVNFDIINTIEASPYDWDDFG